MIVLGLLLLLVVAVVGVIVVSAGGDPVRLHLHWFTMSTNGGTLFIAGAVSVVVAVVAILVLRAGLRRARRLRHEMKELRQRASAAPQHAPDRPSGHAVPSPDPSRRHQDADDYYDSAPRD